MPAYVQNQHLQGSFKVFLVNRWQRIKVKDSVNSEGIFFSLKMKMGYMNRSPNMFGTITWTVGLLVIRLIPGKQESPTATFERTILVFHDVTILNVYDYNVYGGHYKWF